MTAANHALRHGRANMWLVNFWATMVRAVPARNAQPERVCKKEFGRG